MSDVAEFKVTNDRLSVLAFTSGASWGIVCSDGACLAGTCIGIDSADHAARVAVGHLRWHASGCRFCIDCDSTLSPDDPTDRCATGTCPARDGGVS
jgi:hypothetical protein